MSQNNASSNETHLAFDAPAPASSTPGSGESGGGCTASWVAVSNRSVSDASAGNGQSTPRGRTQRSTSARAVRRHSRSAATIEDASDVGPSAMVTRSSGVGPTANAAKRKSSGSATRGESELRKQLLHISNEMDKIEKARMELEERVMNQCLKWRSIRTTALNCTRRM